MSIDLLPVAICVGLARSVTNVLARLSIPMTTAEATHCCRLANLMPFELSHAKPARRLTDR